MQQLNDDRLRFRGGLVMAFLPVIVFLFLCVLYFVVFKAFDMTALAMSGFLSLLIGAPFAKNYSRFWEHVMRGIGSPTSVSIIVILFMVGMISQMIKATDVASGFVWLAEEIGLSAGLFTFFVFIAVSLISMSTGSSIGTFFTAFPIFYAAGIAIGVDPALLAGAILSGGILGDNLAPISDTTIISSSTQRFRTKAGAADVGGVVRQRSRYALTSAAIAAVAFLVVGLMTARPSNGPLALSGASPLPLSMLIPVAIMLIVAMKTRDIFMAITVGLVLGTITALLVGLITPDAIIGVTDGAPSGFLVEGVASMLGTVALVISVFGIMGVLRGAGVMDLLVDKLTSGRLASSPRGAEAATAIGVSATTLLFGGVNSAAMLSFGPVADEIGARVGLHPYRRSNIMDCFALGLASVVPFLSAYLFIGSLLTSGYEDVPQLSTFALFPTTLYPLILTIVMIIAVATGWGRGFEGQGGTLVRSRSEAVVRPAPQPFVDGVPAAPNGA